MGRRRAVVVPLVVAVAMLATVGCGSGSRASVEPAAPDDDTITVGSFAFDESVLLAELYSQALEARGFHVQRALNLGPREFVAPALAAGLIEFLPEYAGTALQFVGLDVDAAGADGAATHRALARALEPHDVTALAASSAQDANAFVVRRSTAERYGLGKISDLEPVADQLTLGGPPECPSRPLCAPGLQDVYGVEFEDFVPLDAGGPLTRAALDDDVVDVALLFTTDPAITDSDLVVLEDDRGLQPAENITPLVRSTVVEHSGEGLARAVDAVSAGLTTESLRDLNAQVAVGGSDPARVARDWLERAGLR